MTLELEERDSVSIQYVRCRFSLRGEIWIKTASLLTRARSIKDFDTKNLCLLCNAVFARANCSGNVGAVAVAISVISIISKILEELGSTLEFLIFETVLALIALSIASTNVYSQFWASFAYRVAIFDSSVDYESACAGSSTFVVRVNAASSLSI